MNMSETEQDVTLEPCPLRVVENAEGTWDILVDGALTHPRLTQWTKGGAEEAVRIIDEAYRSRASVAPNTRRYFCSCGAALTAEEYVTHYFELGHDKSEVRASVAPQGVAELLDAALRIPAQAEGYIRQAIEMLAAAPLSAPVSTGEQDEWLPIDTAPRTGEEILLAHGNSVWADEWWDNSFWLQCGDGGSHAGEIPTHWRPMPLPPTGGAYLVSDDIYEATKDR